MNPAATFAMPDRTARRVTGHGVGAVVDAALLFLTLMVSSDMLVRLGPGQAVAWLFCYGLVLLRIVMNWPQYGALLVRNTVILAFPFACLISLAWSKAPLITAVSGVQLTMTMVIASYLGARYSLAALMRAVCLVLTLAVILSLLHWATGVFSWQIYSRSGGLVGVFSQKNMLGQRALFAVVVIVAIWLMPRRVASGRMKLIATVAMPLTLLALALSQSMTSVLLVVPLVALLALICLRRVPPSVAAGLALVSALIVALGPVVLAVAGVDPMGTVLAAAGKDATLTGRTELWQVASRVWADNPLLGVGYGAFWAAPEFANARLITQHAGAVTSVSFHNFILEILVGTGLPGLAAMLALLWATTHRLLLLVVHTGSVAASCGLVLVIAIIATSFLGPSLYRAHEFMITLLVMFAVSAQEDRLRRSW